MHGFLTGKEGLGVKIKFRNYYTNISSACTYHPIFIVNIWSYLYHHLNTKYVGKECVKLNTGLYGQELEIFEKWMTIEPGADY